ncbi:hypothetical protein FKW77_002678 [Venturia effusa]|uniref:Uncharacterized protein n=1 Tax=Venturia effusa TaxID=50376 RepID=A0A517L108_9PEZI|nr:hypothetical protein FKW77_002678 [Venturia effusa]
MTSWEYLEHRDNVFESPPALQEPTSPTKSNPSYHLKTMKLRFLTPAIALLLSTTHAWHIVGDDKKCCDSIVDECTARGAYGCVVYNGQQICVDMADDQYDKAYDPACCAECRAPWHHASGQLWIYKSKFYTEPKGHHLCLCATFNAWIHFGFCGEPHKRQVEAGEPHRRQVEAGEQA